MKRFNFIITLSTIIVQLIFILTGCTHVESKNIQNVETATDILQYYYGEHYVTDSCGEAYFAFSTKSASRYWKALKVNEDEYSIIESEEAQLDIEIQTIDWSRSILLYSISNLNNSEHTFWDGDIHLQQCIDDEWYYVIDGYASNLTSDIILKPNETKGNLVLHLDIIWDETTDVVVTDGAYRILYEYSPSKYISEEFNLVWP